MLLLYFIRFIFFVTATSLLVLGLNETAKTETDIKVFGAALVLTIVAIFIEWLTPKKSLSTLAGIFFGLLVGLIISLGFNKILEFINERTNNSACN